MSPMFSTVTLRAIGTTAIVVVEEDVAAEAERLLIAELEAIDRTCSRFREDSELSRINASAGRITRVSPLFAEALRTALRAAEHTDGAVDPTIAPALITLGYDRDFASVPTESPAEVHGAPPAGWQTVTFDARGRLLRLPAEARLDLGATAKALAADRASVTIARETGSPTLVNLGGDIATAGPAPAGGWRIRVTDDHGAPQGAPGQEIIVAGGGLATSSTTIRSWRRASRRVHHIVDPRTGEPANPVWRTVTVAAASCVEANTASTAAIVQGASAPDQLEALGLPARLVRPDGDIVTVGDWPVAA